MKRFFSLFFLILLFSYNQSTTKKVELNLDESLTRLSLKDLQGKDVLIEKFLQKPLLINYWATWCKPCKKEFPYFNEFIKKYKNEINVVMISDENLAKLNQFKAKNSSDFTYLKSDKKLREYHIRIIPTTTFYNAKGEHLESIQGSVDLKILEDMIEYHTKNTGI